MSPIPVRWRARLQPLPPAAVVGCGAVAEALLRRMARVSEDTLATFEGVAGPGVLVVLGEANPLPWVDGVVYLGRDPRAPRLLLPTAQEPELHPGLLEQAVLLRSKGSWKTAVLLDPPRLIVLEAPRMLDPQGLSMLKGQVTP